MAEPKEQPGGASGGPGTDPPSEAVTAAPAASDAVPAGDRPRDVISELIDAAVDLLVTVRDWVRQEVEGVVREKVAAPLQEVGVTVGAMMAAATLLVLGLIFVAVAAIVYLCQLVGVPLAFLIIGLVYLLGSLTFFIIKARQMRRSAEALERSRALRQTTATQSERTGP